VSNFNKSELLFLITLNYFKFD